MALGDLVRKLIEIRGKLVLGRAFRRLKNPIKLQEEVLLNKILINKDSDFGKKFQFEKISDIKTFQKLLPLTEYEDYSDFIERVKLGEKTAMFGPQEKIHMFALTSGTTGNAKYIPVTNSFLKEYEEGSKLWSSSVALEIAKEAMEGKVLPIVSPIEEEVTETGFACGAVSGLIAKKQGKLVRFLYAAPYEASAFKTSKERQYAFLRAAAEDLVSVIVTANPSTLIQFAKTIEQSAGLLVQDLRNGTLWGKPSAFKLKKLPARASEIEGILKTKGKLMPRDLWPTLSILGCWKGGTLFHYLEKLPQFYGDVKIRELGLLASEGRFSLPVFSDSDDGLLNVFHHFFEFIPEDEEDLKNPNTLLAHELERGKRYFMVVTTSSGLYRYQLHDLIEVTGFFNNVPIIHFLNKGKHIASLTGEKLTEHQVTTTFHKVAEKFKKKLSFYRLFPSYDPTPHYRLYVEEGSIDVSQTESFMEDFDKELRSKNIEYASKRLSGRLDLPTFCWVKQGVFSEEHKNSHRPEQFKPIFLDPNPKSYLKFQEQIVV